MSKKDLSDHPHPASKIVLNFTDALTPVTWVFHHNDAHDVLLKIEPADNGLHIVQKINARDVSDVEDLAFYSTRYKAIMALRRISRQLQTFHDHHNAHRGSQCCHPSTALTKLWSCFKSLCTWLVIIGTLFYLFIGTQAAGYVLLELLKARQDVMALHSVAPQPAQQSFTPPAPMPMPMGESSQSIPPKQAMPIPAYEPKIIPPHQAMQMIETQPAPTPAAPAVTPTTQDVEAVGVPLSAEEYLEKRAGRLF